MLNSILFIASLWRLSMCSEALIKLAIDEVGKLGGGVVLVRDVPALQKQLQLGF